MPSFSLPLVTIPLYYLLAGYPHGHAIWAATKGQVQRHDNRNPKSSTNAANLQKRLTPREYAAYERAESCHRNHLENMPLLIAAVFAGLLAEQRVGQGGVGLNAFCVGWMVIRVAYTWNYIVAETVKWSYLRTALYFAGTGWAFSVIGRAALVLGS